MKLWKRLISLTLALVLALGTAAMLAPQARAEDNDGPACLHWVSGWAYGSETYFIPKDQRAYLCYELYADGTGETKFNDVYNYDYTAVVTIYRPDGTVATTKTVSNDDEYWVYFKTGKLGTYTYEIVFSGQLYGTFTGSYTVYDPEDSVVRLAGANRFDTAIKVADEMKYALNVEKFDTIVIASGMNFADALSGSYLASVKNAPILLTWSGDSKYDYLNEAVADYVKDNLAEGGTVYILGSTSAVPGSVDSLLSGCKVKRLAGSNRFETNLAILKEAGVGDKEILVCTGTNFADSLSASATGLPILLVYNESGKLTDSQKAWLSGLSGNSFRIVGGENAVGGGIANALSGYGSVSRLAGENRFETSVLVAERYFGTTDSAVLAYAWNFPDGLCGGPLAYAKGCPLILTMDYFEGAAQSYTQEKGVQVGVVLGSGELISDSAVKTIFSMSAEDVILVK